MHFKFDAQFWDVLFSTMSLACLLSFSVIQAWINNTRKSRRVRQFKPESGLRICINLCVATQVKNLCKTQRNTAKWRKLEGSELLSILTPCSSMPPTHHSYFCFGQLLHQSLGLSKEPFLLACPQLTP